MGERPTRWYDVGSSDAADGENAGREAATAALTGPDPGLVVILSQVRDDLTAVAAGVRAAVAAYPGSAGGSGLEVHYRVAEVGDGSSRDAAAAVAECATDLTLPHQALLMFLDSLGKEQQNLIRGAYSVLGAATPLVGGSSGDDLTYSGTYQFAGGRDHVDVRRTQR